MAEWQQAPVRNRKRKKKTNPETPTKAEDVLEEPKAENLNTVFQPPIASPEIDPAPGPNDDGWTIVETKKGKKEEEEEEKKKGKKKRKRKPKPKPLSDAERDAIDKQRAITALDEGDEVEIFSEFHNDWYVGTIIDIDRHRNMLTIKFTTEDHVEQTVLRHRTSEEIRPLRDLSRGCYLPLPGAKKKFDVQKSPESSTETRKKKKKKKKQAAVPKVNTAEEIIELIDDILKYQGPTMGLTEIANAIKDHLSGGSWNGKKYKAKFGSLRKFLSRYDEKFIVENVNNQIMVTRIEPEPEPEVEEVQPDAAPVDKPKQSSSCMLIFITLFFPVMAFLLAIFVKPDNKEKVVEVLAPVMEVFAPMAKKGCKVLSDLSNEWLEEDLSKHLGC